MTAQRHQSSAELPPAPLDFAFPLAVPDAVVLGAVILHEAPHSFALHLFQALRHTMAWAEGPEVSGPLFDSGGMREWEAQVLTTEGVDEALWAPVGVIAGEMCRPAEVDVPRLAKACLAITDWAIGCGAHGTALLFAEAAAAVWPNNARMAWIAGWMHFEREQFGKAEVWFRRAKRIGVWTGDWDAQALAMSSLGRLRLSLGDLPGARENLTSAVRLSKRRGLADRQAKALHTLFVVATYAGNFDEAEAYAKQAATVYGSSHPDLINLAFDVSHFWIQQGHFARALSVLREMDGRFEDPDRQARVAASTARAAGAVGEPEVFHSAWSDAWAILDSGSVDALRAAAALELGLGALSLKLWPQAEVALTTAREEAERRREGDTLAKAEAGLENLKNRHSAEIRARSGKGAGGRNDLAGQLARCLMEQRWAPVQTGAHQND
jgi:tetratricopeptide (TPR) repeat protein